MATFTKKNWITGETITDTKLNNEKGYYLLEIDLNNTNGFELQVGDLTEDDLLNIIYSDKGNYFSRMLSWNIFESKYTCNTVAGNVAYYPSTGILKNPDGSSEPVN